MTTLADRFRYAVAAFKAGQAVVAAAKEVAAAVPASPGGGGIIAALPTVEQLNAATAFLTTDPRAKAIITAAKQFAAGDAQKLVQAFKAHDWKTVEHTALVDALTVADSFGVPYAGLALKALPFFEYAAQHPADVGDPAMQKATGGDGGINIQTGA